MAHSCVRLFTVLYFFVRSSRYSASYPLMAAILIFKCTEGAGVAPRPLSSFDTHARWQPVTQSARSRRSYGKIEDCEQSIHLLFCNSPKSFIAPLFLSYSHVSILRHLLYFWFLRQKITKISFKKNRFLLEHQEVRDLVSQKRFDHLQYMIRD